MIGATTIKEYRKYFQKDAAMSRRFQPIDVNEPSISESIQILRGLKESLEAYHNISIKDDALVAAVNLSSRYITDRFLPDKAIDLIDEGAAQIKLEIESEPAKLREIRLKIANLNVEKEALKLDSKNEQRLASIELELSSAKEEFDALNAQFESEKGVFGEVARIKEQKEALKRASESYKRSGDFNKAAEIDYGKLPALESRESELNSKWMAMQEGGSLLKNALTKEGVAGVVSKWTQIPVTKMLQSEKDRLLKIKDELAKSIIGQDRALDAIAHVILRNKAGLSSPNRPIGSFLFLGPTGVGKTQAAKSLSDFLFHSKDNLIRIDMSEFMERHSVSKLLGAPPGYIGHDEGGVLTSAVRKRPYSVVLFDEIEKAHPDVFNILLQMLDDGHLMDSTGVRVDFSNTIIILTSNIASEKILGIENQDELNAEIDRALKASFRPELLNRIDEIVAFNGLKREHMTSIVDIFFAKLQERVKEQGFSLVLESSARDLLARQGYDRDFGARPLKRAMYSMIEDELAVLILKDGVRSGDEVRFYSQENKIKAKITKKRD